MKTRDRMINDTLDTMKNRKDIINKVLELIPKIQEVNNAYDGKIMSARYAKEINALDSGMDCKIVKYGLKKYLYINYKNTFIQKGEYDEEEYIEEIMIFHSLNTGYEEDCITQTETGKYRIHSYPLNECLEESRLRITIELAALNEKIANCRSVIEELESIKLQILMLKMKTGGWKYYKQACDSFEPMFDLTSY